MILGANFRSAIARLLGAVNPFTKPAVNSGASRAAARLAEHRAKWDDVPSGDRMTRQRARASSRRFAKDVRSMRKQDAMASSKPGGAASVRA